MTLKLKLQTVCKLRVKKKRGGMRTGVSSWRKDRRQDWTFSRGMKRLNRKIQDWGNY